MCEPLLPLPVQIFFWRQLRPFIRAKLGRIHEVSCMFCQHAPGHHEMKEACMSMEKVLVQNIYKELIPSLGKILSSVPRWHLIQGSLPFILHSTASLLNTRKDLQNLGPVETTLLYTLHWILLDAAEECADYQNELNNPFEYVFSISTIALFVYLFIPLSNNLKDIDFKDNLRLENGQKIWYPIYQNRHPDATCFMAECQTKSKEFWKTNIKTAKPKILNDSFIENKDGLHKRIIFSDQGLPLPIGVSNNDVSYCCSHVPLPSPKDKVFPETIPEESSSTEDEHVVIFTLPPLDETKGRTDGVKEVARIKKVKEVSRIFAGEASIFHVAMGSTCNSSKSTLTIKQVTSTSKIDKCSSCKENYVDQAFSIHSAAKRELQVNSEQNATNSSIYQVQECYTCTDEKEGHISTVCKNIRAATFLDVAVIKCLFISQWQEDGIFWGLQYLYNRLKSINEDIPMQAMPRRRSNSLPASKIQVSSYHSSDYNLNSNCNRQGSDKQNHEANVNAASYSDNCNKAQNTEIHNLETTAEKIRKRTKISDLKAFVEIKLLSKSEKALDRLGKEEAKLFSAEESYQSLNTGQGILLRKPPIGIKNFHTRNYSDCPLNLIKGKSMPSLRYTGDINIEKDEFQIYRQSSKVPNPIITVTENSPTPSDRDAKGPSSVICQLDTTYNYEQPSITIPKSRLTRSQTDSHIRYCSDEIFIAPGTNYYITKEGHIDFQIILKAIHNISIRDNRSCTLRVSELILKIIELLVEMAILKSYPQQESIAINHDITQPSKLINHSLTFDCAIRILRLLGCPHGCYDGIRGTQGDICRSQIRSIFSKLHQDNSKHFANFLRKFIREKPIVVVIEFFHCYLGYCNDPTSLLSPHNQKRNSSKSPDLISQGHCASNWVGIGLVSSVSHMYNPTLGSSHTQNPTSVNATSTVSIGYSNITSIVSQFHNFESHIIGYVFKTLVSRCVKISKQLKTSDNVSIYGDLRQLIAYIKEFHLGIFRRVSLSCILDAAHRPHKRSKNETQTTKVTRNVQPLDMYENNTIDESNSYAVNEKGTKKFLLQGYKKTSTSSNCASLLDTELSEDNFKICEISKANLKKKEKTLTANYEKFVYLKKPNYRMRKLRKATGSKIGSIAFWCRHEYRKNETIKFHQKSESPTEYNFIGPPNIHYIRRCKFSRTKGVSSTLEKVKRRMKDKLEKIGIIKSKKKDILDEIQRCCFSRRNSFRSGKASKDSGCIFLKQRKLISKKIVFKGIQRFSFLLNICQPGTVPDHQLMAAILDLAHAPVVSRAAILLECAHFVHECNKGRWPTWMKLNFPIFRPSMALNNRSLPNGSRKIHVFQRSAGKLFYQWAEALGSTLNDFVKEDLKNYEQINASILNESKQRELVIEDEEEDFLDEASIKLYGSHCPIALRMVACMLLLEITAFLRETYQTIPKSNSLSSKERPAPWEKLYSRDVNRRWSMALSSMGHSQTSAQSLQSISGDRENERKISFVLHEPDNESEGSNKSNITLHGDESQNNEKEKNKRIQLIQGRPFLLRRGTTGNATTASLKRRSLKLRRGTKEGKEFELEAFRRSDSIQSKRKVSLLSDRSDNSEPGFYGEVSGEESPGILSDDQPPESPCDSNDTDEIYKNFPWMTVVVQIARSFNFYCCHQNFCHPYCYRRQMRAGERLIKSVRKVYGDKLGIENRTELFDMPINKNDDKNGKSKQSWNISNQITTLSVTGKESLRCTDRTGKTINDSSTIHVEDVKIEDPMYLNIHRFELDLDLPKESKIIEESSGIKEPLPIMKYIKNHVRNAFHAPLATLLKGAAVISEDLFTDILPVAWELLLETNQEVAASAASLFIISAVRAPIQANEMMFRELKHTKTTRRIKAILKFQILWRFRYQASPRMEDSAHLTFKVPPPGVEFTLPSPKIGIESLPVVDAPWMPRVKTKVEEVTINEERHRSLVTATKTRKKQQTELIKKALKAQDDKQREERATFPITTIPITLQAAYEPSPIVDDHDEGTTDEDIGDTTPRNLTHHAQTALSLFPSALCSAAIQIILLLDDAAVSNDGNAVYEMAYQVIWNCLVEDSALFLRYVLERLTRDHQDSMFKILRHLIRFVPKLPQQAAFALYNCIIGYIMFYVRSPQEEGERLIGTALSILWMVVHSVHGIMFKDLKQILRKEQCDASILLTANVPSAKKIIVHGPQHPDVGGIPSQFPVQEDTQFYQILIESLDFFGIEDTKHKEYFLVDYRTHQIHNPSSYVRDYYFFKRSQYPQLELVHMQSDDAFNALQRQELVHKFVETGKVLLTWAILKNVDMVVQRVVFLHEELIKLPSFPRKALEAHLDLYKGGEIGRELLALDVMHKFMWVRLIARMFEAMAGNFAYSGDIHLFLNVLNGALLLHSEDSCILRYVVATYINAAHNFKNIFSTNGYLLIMPTLLQLYSTHQTNKLVKTTVEYAVKQFYLMNRKPFILQMFGSVSAILDTDEEGIVGEAHKIPSSCLFNLLLSLETASPDPLYIGELVKEQKPLKAIDFCYHDENEMVTILDCISLCVMVISYATDSLRGQQMLTILEAITPCFMQKIPISAYNKGGKVEKDIISQLAITIRTLINNSEALTKYYNRPQKTSPEHKSSTQRNYGKGFHTPGLEFDEEAQTEIKNKIYDRDTEEIETYHKYDFVRSRDTLLNIVGEFVAKCSLRLIEISKKTQEDKIVELLDSKCHIRLADIAHSLLKISPYDSYAMACRGLKRYMNDILPSTDWSNDDMRPALNIILRRLDKTFSKIYKKYSVRRNTNWEAATNLLKGVYDTLLKCPYISHFQYLKSLLNTCQSIIIGDTAQIEVTSSAAAALMSKIPPSIFNSIVLKLIALHVISIGESYTFENVCGGQSMFTTVARTETIMLNLVIPLLLRVGTGRKDVPKLRQSDICFVLSTVLHSLWPGGIKSLQFTVPNLRATNDLRTGSLTFATRDSKTLTKVSLTLYQAAFLALKIVIICFEHELTREWPKILRTMKLLNKRNEASLYLWNFLEFIVTHRTPLYIYMLPFIVQKIGQLPISEHERNMQTIIKEQINGINMMVSKSRGSLLMDLINELKKLREELELRKFDDIQPEVKRNIAETYPMNEDQSRTQRPSLLIDLLSADLTSRSHLNRASIETVTSNSTVIGGEEVSRHQSVNSTSITTRTSQENQMSFGFNEPDSREKDYKFESAHEKPRLQRSMGQSKNTFRLKKTRPIYNEVIDFKFEQPESALLHTESEQSLQVLALPTPTGEVTSLNNYHSFTRKRMCEDSNNVCEYQSETSSHIQQHPQFRQYDHERQLYINRNRLHLISHSDISWDEDTSSTSGYKESCNMQSSTIENNINEGIQVPPSASPDISSKSSSATNYLMQDESFRGLSINSISEEKTLLLTESSQHTNLQHSLLTIFQTQDEDTLI